jgi:ABC-type transport system involved in cytochrome c biogenesis permease subunit
MIATHIVILFASYIAFCLAVLTGLAFLLQDSGLKRKDPAVLGGRAISLELLDRMNLAFVVAGFVLFSVGVIQGQLLARAEWGRFFTGDPRVHWSLITWTAYAAVLAVRLKLGLRGRRVVVLSVMAFLLVLFTFAGVNHVLAGRAGF